ncbi:ester hydrolase C11orf54 homolog isoform X1 [Atheta coriaria]|uniref:ester hydrolase C11orf54 homolog isoform X1 n=2 Tax=Dalotia coriaria TaxID=877792 RepID=UPI0031F3923D
MCISKLSGISSIYFKLILLVLIVVCSLIDAVRTKHAENMVLHLEDVPVQRKPLVVPVLDEVVKVLTDGLRSHFEHVDVAVVDCPDLTKEPFTLASPGLGGKSKLVEVGGPAYLLPLVNRTKLYDITDVAKAAQINPAFIIGAGAGPFDHEKTNCEGIYNLNVQDGKITVQDSKLSRVNASDPPNPIQKTIPIDATNFGLLGNLHVSEGKPGKVLKVHATKRIGSMDFIASIRTSLADYYGPETPVGLGGTFLLKEGKAKTHVMPDFSSVPLQTDDALNEWLQFFNMSAPLISVGTLVTTEYGDIDLRVQHFHLYSHHGQAGHYHIDTTPDVVEYLGFFNLADEIIRVDKPPQSAGFGKD